MTFRTLVRSAACSLAAVASLYAGTATAESGEDAGDAVVADPLDLSREYEAGDSTSAFTLALPEGAACPGDSEHDGWRVQTFIVPAGTDIAEMRFQALRPVSDAPLLYRGLRQAADGGIVTQQMTMRNNVAGEPGLIAPLPALTFAYFKAGTLPAGQYTMGVACTPLEWDVQRFWDIDIEIEEAPDVDPGGLRWRVLGADGEPVDVGTDGRLPSWTTVIAVGVLLIAFAAFWMTRARSGAVPATDPSREEFVQ